MAEMSSSKSDEVIKVKEEEQAKISDLSSRLRKEFDHEKEMLTLQVQEGQASIERLEANNNRRENSLKNQISELQERLQESERRQEELSVAVTATTKPLLRQIEQLQISLTQQQNTSDGIEKSLSTRVRELQGELSAQKERQRQAVEAAMEAHSKCTAMEASQLLMKQEKSRNQVTLERLKAELEQLSKLFFARRF